MTALHPLNRVESLLAILSLRASALDGGVTTLEESLSGQLDDEFESLRDQKLGEHVDTLTLNMPDGLKRYLVRHPYLAGHLRGDFRMSPKQLLMHVAKRVSALTLENAEQGYYKASLPFACLTGTNEYVPLLDEGREFTEAIDEIRIGSVIEKLERATSDLQRVSGNAFDLVRGYLWIVAVRGQPQGAEGLGSRSFQCLPGLALLCNPATACSFEFEEALVHEALHSFLFFGELKDSRLLRAESDASRTIVSPWTGNRLDLHTGIHALFVWIVLTIYWSLEQNAIDSARRAHASQRVSYNARGFESDSFSAFGREARQRTSIEVGTIIDGSLDFIRKLGIRVNE